VDTVHPDLGPHWRHGALAVLSRSPATLNGAVRVGAHTRAVLSELGCTPAEIEELLATGAAAVDE
jgi:crotonobetainyl-CoA:carnitine CoA-transferase CaiB-like acyl-CoA transferase